MSPIVVAVAIVVAGVGVAAWAGRARILAGALTAVVLVAGLVLYVPRFVSSGRPADDALTVLTSNVMLGRADVDAIAALVRDNDVDVLAVQELTAEAAERIAASTIASDLPHAFVRPDVLAQGSAIYSRFPMSSHARLDGFTFATLTATVEAPRRGDVQVFAVHPIPPPHVVRWDSELDRLGNAMRSVRAERPVIALGDFNSTLDHPQFRRLLTDGLRDAGALAGAGLIPTYPTDKWYPPVVGIDHVVVRGLEASSVTAHDIPGSDHRAVLAVLG
ncbi:hypothetical protein nbrc107696_14530 [Gordonia spumicola]|uniref:Endonuclease/exonuclease/phosphatase domain-containing protein n=1 Tax=Gordonia spumicola TaxID=589161 RepID=A0A7I9V6U0_9ACTN|nr:endonuclease/exonuclease/phosphatase family protein [Gordonia spumicola]GEE01007.1 hypothetical protein nbrc107696_14530 [Gordonia spumicola]